MVRNIEGGRGQGATYWRIAVWSGLALMLALPWLAMQVTNEVVWDVTDFVVFGGMLISAGVAYELATLQANSILYRIAAGVAVAAGFVIVWAALAVGIIGVEGDPFDLMYAGVIVVGIVGAVIAHGEARGMARAMFAAALAVGVVAVIALVMGKHLADHSSLYEVLGVNVLFAVLFAASGLLFQQAARAK